MSDHGHSSGHDKSPVRESGLLATFIGAGVFIATALLNYATHKASDGTVVSSYGSLVNKYFLVLVAPSLLFGSVNYLGMKLGKQMDLMLGTLAGLLAAIWFTSAPAVPHIQLDSVLAWLRATLLNAGLYVQGPDSLNFFGLILAGLAAGFLYERLTRNG